MIIHVVKAGESLYQIASRYGVSVNRIVEDNGFADKKRNYPVYRATWRHDLRDCGPFRDSRGTVA